MTTMDELERAVERLADVEAVLRLGQGGIARGTGYARRVASDLRALLSERAELLAAVERMRGEMAGMEARLRRWEPVLKAAREYAAKATATEQGERG